MSNDWRDEVQDMDFERHPQMKKEGKQTFVFKSEGKKVLGSATGYKTDSVVFVIEQGSDMKEMWLSITHPLLRKLRDSGASLIGKKATLEFSGTGLEMRAELLQLE